MTDASDYTRKQEMSRINNDPTLRKTEVLDALTGVSYIESKIVRLRFMQGMEMFEDIVDARTIDILRREKDEESRKQRTKGNGKPLYSTELMN